MEVVAVSDRRISNRPFLDQVKAVCEGGADVFVLREKDLPYAELLSLSKAVRVICLSAGAVFCLDGPPDIASELGLSDVWVPFAYLQENGRPSIDNVWVSVHSPEEAAEAEMLGADRVVFGNVFETTCKPGKPAAGVDALIETVRSTSVPVYAIGGIDADSATVLKDTGIAGVCMRSSLMEAQDPSVQISSVHSI